MAKRSNVIVINGRRYDASTGDLLANQTPETQLKPAIDGFAKPAVKKTVPTPPGKVLSPKQVKKEVRRRVKHASEVHKKTAKSKTLVRASTKKPNTKSFRSKIVTSATAFTIGSSSSAKDDLAKSVPTSRLKHAKASNKSSSISKFAGTDIAAKSMNSHQVASVSKAHNTSLKNQLIAQQMANAGTSSTSTKRKTRKNPFIKPANYVKKSPRITSIVAVFLAAAMLFGYITYLNVPNMALRVAAVKAGFDANMPGYSPNGYRFTGPIAYSPGQITIQFQSNTDEREYHITQRQTSWDSKSLLDNFVKKEVNTDYSTIYDRGLTVYIYDGSNAAWVNGGVWYTVSGESLLSSEQLMRIAASL